MTGKRTSEFPGPVSKLFLDLYEIAIGKRTAIYSEHEPPLNVDVKLWQRLILPLGVNDVEWILAVNLSAGRRSNEDEADGTFTD